MVDPSDWRAIREIAKSTSLRVEVVRMTEETFLRAFDRYFGSE